VNVGVKVFGTATREEFARASVFQPYTSMSGPGRSLGWWPGLESGDMLSATDRLGPYEFVAPLSTGRTGEVYRARDTRLGREVTVKFLPKAFAGDVIWRTSCLGDKPLPLTQPAGSLLTIRSSPSGPGR
jgi:hypothetical protein